MKDEHLSIEMRKDGGDWQEPVSVADGYTGYVLNDLMHNKGYEVRAQFIYESGDGDYSHVERFTTKPKKPSIAVIEVTSSTVLV